MPAHSGGGGGSANIPPGDIGPTKDTQIEPAAVTGVAGNVVTTVLSFTPTVDIRIGHIGGTGSARAEWTILIGGVAKIYRRTGVAHPNLDVDMEDIKVPASTAVEVKVEHYESAVQEFKASVRYYT